MAVYIQDIKIQQILYQCYESIAFKRKDKINITNYTSGTKPMFVQNINLSYTNISGGF